MFATNNYYCLKVKNHTWANPPAADKRTPQMTPNVIPSVLGPTPVIYFETVFNRPITIWLFNWITRPIGEVPLTAILPFPDSFLLLVWPSDPVPSLIVILVHFFHQEVVDLHACNGCKTAILAFTEELRIVPGSRCSWPDEAMFPESLALFFFLARFHTILLTVDKKIIIREH